MSTTAPGTTAARYLATIGLHKDLLAAESYVDSTNWADRLVIKSVVGALGTGTVSTFAGTISSDFIAATVPKSVIGRLPGLRRVPFQTRTVVQTAGPSATWVGEGGYKPISAPVYEELPGLPRYKISSMVAVTKELLATPGFEALLTRDLAKACVSALDQAFISPDSPGVPGEQPPSILTDAVEVPSSGNDAAAARSDLQEVINAYTGDLSSAVFVTSTRVATSLALMQASVGLSTIDLTGATPSLLLGVPLIASDSMPSTSSGSTLTLVDAARVELAGATEAKLLVSREASIAMDSAPGAGALALVSMFQTDNVALLSELWVAWRAAAGGVAYVSGVDYGV